MKSFLILMTFLSLNQLIAQEIVGMKDTYIDNKLVYKVANDSLFSGIAQNMRRNGHLVYEEVFKNGIILSSNLYFNGKEKIVSIKTIYYPIKPYLLSKEYIYNLESEIFEIKTYNDNGIKILIEQFNNGKLTYSCQYLGKKKHGLELGYGENGEKMTYRCEYIDGKKNRTEYCLNEKGIETKKEYRNGKKIK